MKMSSMVLYTVLPVLGAAGILLGLSALFSGCYTLKQGIAMLGYLNRAIPLEKLEAQDGGDGENRRFVERIRDIRRFAQEELGLRETANYTRYVAIERDYLAAVVSAAAKDSFTRHEWWFPVVGKVPYKGFFDIEDARREGEKLKKKDLDLWIRPVEAFSTLGWFKDPLYSYMRRYPVHRLADLLIHETFHATVYLKGRSQFNEELAEFVGREGSRLYLERTFGPDSPEYRAMIDGEADSAAFVAFIQGLIEELDALYRSGRGREEKLRLKEEIIRAAQVRFEETYESRFRSDNYRGFSQVPVNNAYLELYRLYYSGGDYLEDLYKRSGRDLPRLIAAAKTLKSRRDPRQALEAALREK
ncbi:MAG: aminopeptidase [Spirochaetaceae bacterium]|jgi:predicted aminopeptidase|nr:aminopeptidase [Spirochaetaceae bacterium]